MAIMCCDNVVTVKMMFCTIGENLEMKLDAQVSIVANPMDLYKAQNLGTEKFKMWDFVEYTNGTFLEVYESLTDGALYGIHRDAECKLIFPNLWQGVDELVQMVGLGEMTEMEANEIMYENMFDAPYDLSLS